MTRPWTVEKFSGFLNPTNQSGLIHPLLTRYSFRFTEKWRGFRAVHRAKLKRNDLCFLGALSLIWSSQSLTKRFPKSHFGGHNGIRGKLEGRSCDFLGSVLMPIRHPRQPRTPITMTESPGSSDTRGGSKGSQLRSRTGSSSRESSPSGSGYNRE